MIQAVTSESAKYIYIYICIYCKPTVYSCIGISFSSHIGESLLSNTIHYEWNKSSLCNDVNNRKRKDVI